MKKAEKIYRILDANFNRSREGMRVLEEVVRFGSGSLGLQRSLKKYRHELSNVLKTFLVDPKTLLDARDTRSDVGRQEITLEGARIDLADVFMANAQRVKESLRALEEFSKLVDTKASQKIKKIRFEIYAIEQKAVPALETLRDHLSGKDGKGNVVRAGGSGHSGRRRRSSTSR